MIQRLSILMGLCLLTTAPPGPAALAAEENEDGFKSIFNGEDLTDWEGDGDLWTVEDGAITGTTTAEDPLEHNKFLIWRGGEVGDFELRLKFRLTGQNNSGVQYRSEVREDLGEWVVSGYQADIHPLDKHNGMLYEERGRGIVALAGQKVVIGPDGDKQVEAFGDPEEIHADTEMAEWNDFTIIARGNHLIHKMNGQKTVEVIDHQEDKRAMKGILALQVHQGRPMRVQFKDIRLKELDEGEIIEPGEEPVEEAASDEGGSEGSQASADDAERLAGPTPQWIWSSEEAGDEETAYFRKEFTLNWEGNAARPKAAWLTAACDNSMAVSINGRAVTRGDNWQKPVNVDARRILKQGKNVVTVEGRNAGGAAALILRLDVELPGGEKQYIVTDETWRATSDEPAGDWEKPAFDASDWRSAVVLGELDAEPWNAAQAFREASELSKPIATWRFRESTLGWEAHNDATAASSQAALHVTSEGSDPYITRDVSVPAGELALVLRARSDKDQAGQVFWSTTDQPGFAEERSEEFKLTGDHPKWHEYTVHFEPDADLTALRIDTGNQPGEVQIQSIILKHGERPQSLATPGDELELPEGFEAELLYSVPKEEQGSWVSITFDDEGRIITSDQYGKLYRVTPPALENGAGEIEIEGLDVNIGMAQGMLYAFDSLYVMVNGTAAQGPGFYRLRDTNGDGQFDQVEALRTFSGNPGTEHGPHSIVLGPDGESLYVIGGNMSEITEDLTDSRVPTVWGEDQLLPRMPDARGHARNTMAPGGAVIKTDPDGETWELIHSGFRNPYDLAFNPDGELFTFDADMEWDIGSPWYRPTRINHVVSGGESGWRNGTGKWPAYYPDSLPAAVNIGIGSPTGIVFGTEADFPPKYRRALFALDWSYGIIYAVHLRPDGSSYTGDFEKFVQGKPLPVTDVAIGPDGAMYFTTGGRRTQSGLYRVTYTGDKSTEPAPRPDNPEAKQARETRHMLESLHEENPRAVDKAWEYLNSDDRFIRTAARIAVEHQPVDQWARRALEETRPWASLTALLALTRHGEPSMQADLLDALGRLDPADLTEPQQLAALRVLGLAFIRMGEPDRGTASEVISRLAPLYPAESTNLNIELSRMLAYLQAPNVVETTLDLLAEAETQEEQIHYALVLRVVENGWNLDRRKQYFAWFNHAGQYTGGASFGGFLENIKEEALKNVPDDQKKALQPILDDTGADEPSLADIEPRSEIVENWTVEKLLPAVRGDGLRGRDFDRGRLMFAVAQCYSCHRFNGEGGALGPDLTGLGGRFTAKDLLESTILPSKAISDQYDSHIITTKDGRQVFGRILSEEDGTLEVAANPLDPDDVTEIPAENVTSKVAAPISLMPPGLISTLNEEEVLDLIAYLLSGGNRDNEMFE